MQGNRLRSTSNIFREEKREPVSYDEDMTQTSESLCADYELFLLTYLFIKLDVKNIVIFAKKI